MGGGQRTSVGVAIVRIDRIVIEVVCLQQDHHNLCTRQQPIGQSRCNCSYREGSRGQTARNCTCSLTIGGDGRGVEAGIEGMVAYLSILLDGDLRGTVMRGGS